MYQNAEFPPADLTLVKPLTLSLGFTVMQAHKLSRNGKGRVIALSLSLSTSFLLAEEFSTGHWISFLGDESQAAQLRAVRELAKDNSPSLALFLRATDPKVFTTAASAIIEQEELRPVLPHLARALFSLPSQDEETVALCLQANVIQGDPESAQRIVHFATHRRVTSASRRLALQAIHDFITPTNSAPRSPQELAPLRKAYLGALDTLTSPRSLTPETFQSLLSINQLLETPFAPDRLRQLSNNEHFTQPLRCLAIQELPSDDPYFRNLTLTPEFFAVKLTAIRRWHETQPHAAIAALAEALNDRRQHPDDRIPTEDNRTQQILLTLASFETPEADRALSRYLNLELSTGSLSRGVWLEVEDILTRRPDLVSGDTQESFRNLVRKAHQGPNPEAPLIEYAYGGDPVNGSKIFHASTPNSCASCHGVDYSSGKENGPYLFNFPNSNPSLLMRALIAPQMSLTTGYGQQTLTLKDGSIVHGQEVARGLRNIQIETAVHQSVVIDFDEIETVTYHSPMPSALGTLSPREIRDVIAYLQNFHHIPVPSDK